MGEGKKYISAIIVPSFPLLETLANDRGIQYSSHEDLVTNPEIVQFYQERIENNTQSLGQVEKIKTFTLLPHELTQEAGELTPTSKIKRKVINKKYQDLIENMYS